MIDDYSLVPLNLTLTHSIKFSHKDRENSKNYKLPV